MGRAPGRHFESNLRVRRELPHVFCDYRDLYMMSMRARYRDGHRLVVSRRRLAVEKAGRIDEMLPF